MRAAGAITLGKTNTPEFGAGSQTFNTVFGATRNPYDLTQDLRRQQRRRGGGAGLRHAADRRRQRHRRLAAQSRGVLQRGRASGRRPAACRASRHRGRRCRWPARWRARSPMSRSSSARSPDPTRAVRSRSMKIRRAFRAPLGRNFKGVARRLVARPRRHSVRARDPPRRRRQPAGLRGPRLHRRGGRAGLHRR